MSTEHIVNVDLAKLYDAARPKSVVTVLGWGDYIEVTGPAADGRLPVLGHRYHDKDGQPSDPEPLACFLKIPKGKKQQDIVLPAAQSKVLKVNFVDVQQGDACVIETPAGRVILVDGGENQMFARYLAARYRNTTATRPKAVDAIVVSHGDADHFSGLTEIFESETNPTPKKRLFIHPDRIYHNGIFKRPAKDEAGKERPDVKQLNDTVQRDSVTYLMPLVDDPTRLADKLLNKNFVAWKKAVATWRTRGAVDVRRLDKDSTGAFDFVANEGVKIEVLGPLAEPVDGKPALRFLGKPPEGPRIGHAALDTDTAKFTGYSASHTINGHSIILRLSYGGFSFLFAGDLNDQAERVLTRLHSEGKIDLTAEVLKTPHHGSADFAAAFLQAVSPLVSVISSGDESEQKEYIHPRATLVGALGRYSRVPEPLVFCTELVAFFKRIGWSYKDQNQGSAPATGTIAVDVKRRYYGFDRTSYGIVKVRTDGQRLLVYTNSGKDDLKEAYAYERDNHGQPVPAPVRLA